MAFHVLRRRLLATSGIVGTTWAVDELYGHQVLQRSLRTFRTGIYLLWEYKVRWTPETSGEVHARVAQQVVACMRKNEGLYVKFGQAMATMDVVLPNEWKRELNTLCDQAATFPFSQVRMVLEGDLGRTVEDIFEEFDENPIASASIAQVHKARLRPQCEKTGPGMVVAVKVQKPNIPAQNGCDLAMYKLVLNVMEYAFDLPLAWTYDYTRRQLEAELDFRIEARNAERAAREFEECPALRGKVIVPVVQDVASGERVMTMEWIDSIGAVSNGKALRGAGLRPQEVMRVATEVFGHQIFSTGHVHCDPHPGNLLVRHAPADSTRRWQLVLLDHGLYCELPPKLRQEYADFWVAAALSDRDTTVRICRSWGIKDEEAAELFASLTQFRRVRLTGSRAGSVASLFAQTPGQSSISAQPRPHKKLSPEEVAAAQARLKARAKQVLGDTRAFPQELLFVGRSLNMIRSANFALGSAVNRVAILAECAATGSAIGDGVLGAMDDRTRRLAKFRFHFKVQTLVLMDRVFRAGSGMRDQFSSWRNYFLGICSGVLPLILWASSRRGRFSTAVECSAAHDILSDCAGPQVGA